MLTNDIVTFIHPANGMTYRAWVVGSAKRIGGQDRIPVRMAAGSMRPDGTDISGEYGSIMPAWIIG